MPADVTTPLPSLTLRLDASDAEPQVDILVERGKAPIVALVHGDPALEKPLAQAIQSDLIEPLPDSGPEKLLRRARVTCSSAEKPVCALHFLGSQVAMQASSGANPE